MADHLETERTYEAGPGFILPPLHGLPGVTGAAVPELVLLEAVYYDTADLALLRNKVTLRRRTGGADEGWHLKLPAGPDTRKELREPPGAALPPRLATAVASLTAGRPLIPVARITTQRHLLRLAGPDGTVLGEIADDAVTAERLAGRDLAGGDQVVSWREIEVETDRAELLNQAGELLQQAGARPARSASKLGMLLGNLRADS